METEVREMELTSYMARFRDVARFEPLCRECPNYGSCWLCPPFEREPDFSAFDRIRIVACRLPVPQRVRSADVMEVLSEPRQQIERELLVMEGELGGRAFGFSGQCPYCKECSRRVGKECRHPDKARPSLEAFGFDLCSTMEELFGRRLGWASGPDDSLREITLIGAVVYKSGL